MPQPQQDKCLSRLQLQRPCRAGAVRWEVTRTAPTFRSGVDGLLDAVDAVGLALFAGGMRMGGSRLLRAIRTEAIGVLMGTGSGILERLLARLERFAQAGEGYPGLFGAGPALELALDQGCRRGRSGSGFGSEGRGCGRRKQRGEQIGISFHG